MKLNGQRRFIFEETAHTTQTLTHTETKALTTQTHSHTETRVHGRTSAELGFRR